MALQQWDYAIQLPVLGSQKLSGLKGDLSRFTISAYSGILKDTAIS